MTAIVLPTAGDIESSIRVAQKHENGTAKPIRRRFTVRTEAGGRSNVWVPVRHDVDPKQAILDQIGKIPEGLVQFSRILVAVYQPPIVEKTAGGILMAQKIQEEDRLENLFQGKTGLCVALGPDCYQDTEDLKFSGQKVEVGDWVWFRPSDGMPCDVNEKFCRVFDAERFILGKLPHPDMVA